MKRKRGSPLNGGNGNNGNGNRKLKLGELVPKTDFVGHRGNPLPKRMCGRGKRAGVAMNATYTVRDLKKFLLLYKKFHGNATAVCKRMGIGGMHMTVRRWRESYPWFDEGMTQVREAIFDKIEENVFEAAVDGPVLDPVALGTRKFLLTYHPEGRKRGYCMKSEVTGEDGGPIKVAACFLDLIQLADEERKNRQALVPSSQPYREEENRVG